MIERIAYQVPGGYNIQPVAGMPTGGMSTFQTLVQRGTTILFIIAILLTLFFLIWGGIEWITSGGSKEKLDAARKKIIYSIIGLIIVLSSFMIINIVSALLGADFSFGT